jgi:hypothetical protein
VGGGLEKAVVAAVERDNGVLRARLQVRVVVAALQV